MKKQITTTIGIILFILCLGMNVQAQSLNFTWANTTNGNSIISTKVIKTDPQGNIYISGEFYGTADMDPSLAGTDLLTSEGNSDVYIKKVSSTGSLIWAKQIGGNGIDQVRDIVVDATGNVYVTGRYSQTVDFNPNSGTTNRTSNGNYDVFLLKLDDNGDYEWSRVMGGSQLDEGRALTLSSNEANIFLTGIFSGTVDMRAYGIAANRTSNGSTDVFVKQFTSAGGHGWAKNFGGTSADYIYAMESDANDDLFLAGRFNGTVDFNPDDLIAAAPSSGGTDIFVQKISSSGNYSGYSVVGGSQNDYVSDISIMGSNVYVCGAFQQSVTFRGTNYSSAGGRDGCVFSLTRASLSRVDFAQLRSTDDVTINTIHCASNEIIIGGEYEGATDFDPHSTNFDSFTSNGDKDLFVQRLSSTLNYTTAPYRAGSTGIDIASCVWQDSDGEILACGSFENTIQVNTGTNITSAGNADGLLLKFGLAPLSINNLSDNEFTFDIYPNPAQGLVTIESQEPIENVAVYNITGKLIKYQSIRGNQTTLDISDLPPSNYLLKVNDTITKHIIKQ